MHISEQRKRVQSFFIYFFSSMSIIQSSRGKYQLLFDGFQYRKANNSQVTWRCVRNICAGRLTIHFYFDAEILS